MRQYRLRSQVLTPVTTGKVRLDDSELGDFPAHQPKQASRLPPNAGRVLGLQETLDGGSLRVFPDRRWLNPLDTISEQNSLKVKDLSFRNIERLTG
jgi:hypothetical protein